MSEQNVDLGDGESSGGWGTGKIILVVVLVLGGLSALCCGIGGYVLKDAAGLVEGPFKFAMQAQAEFGEGTVATFEPDPKDPGRMVVLVGIPGGVDENEVAGIQDRAWKIYAETHAEGEFPAGRLAVGRTGGTLNTKVVDWQENAITFEELEERTGVAAPPTNQPDQQEK